MVLYEAGDCLKYAMGRECESGFNGSDGFSPNHLSAFLVYFFLTNRIAVETIQRIEMEKKRYKIGSRSFDLAYHAIFKYILTDLKRYYRFSSSEKLFDLLNEEKIPGWVFDLADVLIKMIPGVYLINDCLFDVVEEYGMSHFRCVPVDKLPRSFDVASSDILCEQGLTISNKYSEIFGYDPQRKVLFLKLKHSSFAYAEYYLDEKTEIIHNYMCLGLADTFPVILDEGNLSVVVGNTKKVIKKYDPFEIYLFMSGFIRVISKDRGKSFFKPYILKLDGSREETSYEDCAVFLVEKIDRDIKRGFDRLGFIDHMINHDYRYEKIKEGDIYFAFFESLFDDVDQMKNKYGRLYIFILNLLKEYLPLDVDLLEYFYMFGDVSKHLWSDERNILIDEALYRRLNELHLSGKLGNVIHDIEGLKALLIEEDPGNDEKVEQYREQMTVHYDIKIGQFKFQDENIWYAVGSQSDITIKANHLVIKEEIRKKDHAGMVSYNLLNGIYEVQYDRLMSKDEQYAVMDGFSISENRVRFYVNSCLG